MSPDSVAVVGEDHDVLHDAAPAYDDVEAKRARAGVAAALFGGSLDEDRTERVAVGRYEIASRLGAGGMGVVYRAHDPDLDRPVAVKLLHSDSSTDEKARARMLREARALAKLSHPNVITVYDVGTDDGRVFVAMELVAGRDLRRWLEQHRSAGWREILALFIAAGRGLAAAHEVALVHRDFKPENVLVGDDGRVRVLDFGLARLHRPVAAASDADGPPPPSLRQTDPPGVAAGGMEEAEGLRRPTPRTRKNQLVSPAPASPMDQTNIANLPTSAFSGGLTETGALIGTPLYMAPELYAGKPADERSDQFAFCASLYEGLYRQLPFGERSLAAHMDAVAAGRVVAPPEHSPVPPSLWKLVARGLDADPLARHPGMGSLLDALEREAAQPVGELARGSGAWRVLAIAGGVGLLVAGWVGVEMGWFAGKGADAQAQLGGGELAVGDPAGVDARAIDASATKTSEPAQAQPELAEVEPEPEQPEPEQPEPEPEQPERASETGSSEASVALEAAPAVEPGPELNGWCHLHEDHLTLIKRTDSRRAQIEERGKCYRCRVERRRSRWRSFSPRDCAGYSLCGPVAAEECK